MILKETKTLWMAGLLAGMGFSALAGDFAPPAEGPVAFRRDRIPLDPDAMVTLSRQLETMARGLDAETPADRRGAAQMLALALALDPANSKARELVAEYQEDRHKPDADAERLEKSRTRVWQNIAWLETPEAGSQGQALAACLKDVIIVSDPKHPKAGPIREGGEKGAWAGWIPAVSAYDAKAIAGTDEPKTTDPVVPAVSAGLETARVTTLLWQKVGKTDSETWVLAPLPLEMTSHKSEKPENAERPFFVTIGTGEEGGSLTQISNSIQRLLKKQHDNLPAGVHVTITSKELEKSLESKNRQSISGAAAVLASSAVTGREPDAVILGLVDDSGAFKLSTGFWDQLQALGKGNGQRLVLPMEAGAYLPSILAMERPAFFMEYEVILAADFKQLLDLTAKKPEGQVASAIAKFREIRERSGTQDVRQYIANTFVKQRLMTVLQEVPTHISAKMLLTQAAGNRPTLVSRAVLAAELRRALEPMVWIVKIQDHELGSADIAKIGQTYETCRTRVDGLERYAEKNDRGLLDQSRELVIAIRNLDRATRTRGENYVVTEAVRTARSELARQTKSLAELLDNETGEGRPAGGN